MKKIFGLLVISLWLNGCKQSDPEDVLGRDGDVVYFSGYTWDVKHNEYAVGPGPNYFSRFYEDIYIDENGYLHMRIAEHDGKWYSTEIVGRDTLGYGKYTWVMQADLENIPENITVGLFTWDNESFFAEANSEVDIEFSKWGNPDLATTLHYSVQPVAFGPTYPERTHNAFTEPGDLVGVTTHVFTWTDTLIEWRSYKGDSTDPLNETAYWSFDLDNPARVKNEGGNSSEAIVIPGPGPNTNARINFWLLPWIDTTPTDGLEQEIIVRRFEYEAM
ncbi:MAG: hypothetical protein WBP31_18135 [Chitinophagales bacterium]|jgi:hypothetical protein|nr:hypothetical protein [Bacteroidota bacterium]MBP8250135.1 hypothetical protein [Chitinophagales bacterium]